MIGIRTSSLTVLLGAALLLAPLGLPATASAQDTFQPVNARELRCRKGISRAARRYLERTNKAREACFQRVVRGVQLEEVDCVLDVGDERLDLRIQKIRALLGRLLPRFCVGIDLTELNYPGQCLDDNGAPFNVADLEECIIEETDRGLAGLYDFYYPPEVGFEFEESDRRCILGAAERVAQSLQQERRRREACLLKQEQRRIDEDIDCRANIVAFGEGTGDEKLDTSIRNAHRTAFGQIPVVCATATLEDLGYNEDCPDMTGPPFDTADLQECLYDTNREAVLYLLGISFPPAPVCGNGELEAAEECDDGDLNSDEIADACRSTCVAAFCGDGVVDPSNTEGCDDGNDDDEDGCTSACEVRD
jgi:cysteine-rich repeat protein